MRKIASSKLAFKQLTGSLQACRKWRSF